MIFIQKTKVNTYKYIKSSPKIYTLNNIYIYIYNNLYSDKKPILFLS